MLALSYLWFLLTVLIAVFVSSQNYGEASTDSEKEIKERQQKFLKFNSKDFEQEWLGKKIPIETAIEAFQDNKIDFKLKGRTLSETLKKKAV